MVPSCIKALQLSNSLREATGKASWASAVWLWAALDLPGLKQVLVLV